MLLVAALPFPRRSTFPRLALRRSDRRIRASIPGLVDALAAALGSGLSLPLAFAEIAPTLPPPLAGVRGGRCSARVERAPRRARPLRLRHAPQTRDDVSFSRRSPELCRGETASNASRCLREAYSRWRRTRCTHSPGARAELVLVLLARRRDVLAARCRILRDALCEGSDAPDRVRVRGACSICSFSSFVNRARRISRRSSSGRVGSTRVSRSTRARRDRRACPHALTRRDARRLLADLSPASSSSRGAFATRPRGCVSALLQRPRASVRRSRDPLVHPSAAPPSAPRRASARRRRG